MKVYHSYQIAGISEWIARSGFKPPRVSKPCVGRDARFSNALCMHTVRRPGLVEYH